VKNGLPVILDVETDSEHRQGTARA